MTVSTADLLAGQPLALARAISQVERQDAAAEALLAALFPRTGQGQIIGIAGPPGSGKSTLLTALATHLSATTARKVAILAVDPTSHVTGGALLGDRIRMTGLDGTTDVFIRSLATRGASGTLSAATWDAVTVLDALGFDPIFIETVGAGQNEHEIRILAHTTVLVEAPGLGDSVQTLKAGLLEVCDIAVVNKADRPGCHRTAQRIQQMLHLGPAPAAGAWQVPVLTTDALSGTGVPGLWAQIRAHCDHLNTSGQRQVQDRIRRAQHVDRLVQQGWAQALPRFIPPAWQAQVLAQVHRQQLDPHSAARVLLQRLPKPPAMSA